jgi:SRSO17 transposase
MAVGHSVDAARWRVHFEELMGRIAGRFARVEPRRWVRDLLLGLLSDLPIKNCWTLSEHAGDGTPAGMQHLLRKAVWDVDGVRDDLRGYVVDNLGAEDAVLVVDETGDLKKGIHTVGVQRQYTGTAGRIENAQVAVYLTYATGKGHALVDRALYLPKCWTEDRQRRESAGVPDDVEFTTKPALAREMIARALDAGVHAGWVAGDEVYGADPGLRGELEHRRVGYVLAVACSHPVCTTAVSPRADAIAASLPTHAWQRLSAGQGSKGPRFYDWAWISIDADTEHAGQQWLLIRRNTSTGELAYYRCYTPEPVGLVLLSVSRAPNWDDLQTGSRFCCTGASEIKGAGRNVSPGASKGDQERWAAGHR